MQVSQITIGEIKTRDRSREDYGDVEALAESINENGLIQPITVDDKMNLLAGGRRLEAVIMLGWTDVPAVVRKGGNKSDNLEIELVENIQRKDLVWHERAKLEKRIFDLKSDNEAGWSQRKQAKETGWSHDSINRRLQLAEAIELLPDLAECSTEDEAWKKYKKLEEDYHADVLYKKVQNQPTIREAIKWAEEHYKVGNALEEMPSYDEGMADFAEVDPPYAVDIVELKSRAKDEGARDRYNEIEPDSYEPFIDQAARQVYRLLKNNTFCIWWHGSTWYAEVLTALKRAGFNVNAVPALWYKGSVGQSSQPDVALASCYEPFFVARKGKPKFHKPGRTNVFHYSPVHGPKKIHSTEKPLPLMRDIVETMCFPGSTILCPFLGSGITLRAAYETNNTGFGWDLDEGNKKEFLRVIAGEQELEDA